jgi:hypothetical protein
MGILTTLTTQGSAYTSYDGTTPTTNPLATQQSKLHSDGTAGYSLNGAFSNQVSNQMNTYQDGQTNPLPLPSQLDLNGATPSQYILNAPEVGGSTLNNNFTATPFG